MLANLSDMWLKCWTMYLWNGELKSNSLGQWAGLQFALLQTSQCQLDESHLDGLKDKSVNSFSQRSFCLSWGRHSLVGLPGGHKSILLSSLIADHSHPCLAWKWVPHLHSCRNHECERVMMYHSMCGMPSLGLSKRNSLATLAYSTMKCLPGVFGGTAWNLDIWRSKSCANGSMCTCLTKRALWFEST